MFWSIIGNVKRLPLFIFLIIIVCLLGFLIFKFTKEKVKQDFAWSVPFPTVTPQARPAFPLQVTQESNSLFVPYWSLKSQTIPTNYDEYIYFGIAPNKDGIDLKEEGAKNLDSFLSLVPQDKKKYLTVRMINNDLNFEILKDSAKQNKIISDSITIAKENNFNGIILDLEVTAIPFESLVKQITDFTAAFSKSAHDENLQFSITMYGDVFYRVRPFDVKTLSSQADRIFIMAYDFSKAKGNPGPNFPLFGEEKYGYDLQKMTADFSAVVNPAKITVVFGLFGYDWLVDSQDRTLSQAKSLSSSEIEKKFIDDCAAKSCSYSRDSVSLETEIHYRDLGGGYHIIWFEDLDSARAKKGFLKSRGVGSFSYWAYSYF